MCPHMGGGCRPALEPDSLSLECDPEGRDILLRSTFPQDTAVSGGTGLGSLAVDFRASVLHELFIASVSMECERGHLGGHLGAGQGQTADGLEGLDLWPASRIRTKARGDRQELIHLDSF